MKFYYLIANNTKIIDFSFTSWMLEKRWKELVHEGSYANRDLTIASTEEATTYSLEGGRP